MQNNMLENIAARAPNAVLSAIKSASAKTGVNFAYLLQQADVESSFRPDVKAQSSSATGLYQFIESTWLGMVNKYGAKYGLGNLASKIDADGHVSDRATRNQILSLRKNPQISSLMAAEFASENELSLKQNWGGDVGSTELYLAHFLGPGQAGAFLRSKDSNPMQPAAALFPDAARSNRAVFYDGSRQRSLQEVYAFFDKKFSVDSGAQYKIDNAPSPELTPETLLQAQATTRLLGNNAESYAGATRASYSTFPFRAERANGEMKVSSLPSTYYRLVAAPVDVMMLAELSNPAMEQKTAYN